MNLQQQIEDYINSQPASKRSDMQILHQRMLQLMPGCKLWFLDGRNDEGKVVSNPNIGYGLQTMHYADGKSREFYQVGISANTSGISVYIMGIENKNYLPDTFRDTIGKASVSGYCIKFKALQDINMAILETAILEGMKASASNS